jgi:uncharacterized protein (DUF3084 family)
LQQELKDVIEREKRLNSDFNELEEENCSLQRTLAHLKLRDRHLGSIKNYFQLRGDVF